MAAERFPSGTVTFLFTDIEGSTRLWQEMPEPMRAALVRHDEILRDAVTSHRGYLVKTMGDGVHAAFGAAHDAIDAALAAQRALAVEQWGATGRLRVRMGIHSGPAEMREGDYYGTAVNRAARLMSAAHGAQVICSQATAELMQDDLRDGVELVDLGEHRLRDLARPVRVLQVVADGLVRSFPPLRSLDNAPTNLPMQPTALVGRGKLISELASLLERERLVTLTGVGGVGKTRLALEVGAEVLPLFADGVWLVELGPIAHDEMVLVTIADALGLTPQIGESLATSLVNKLKSKRLLLIIDNCEHVLTPVARFVDRVVTTASGVRVVATSREPLGIAAERVRAVPPLAEDTEAVELFIDRALHVDASFDSVEQMHAIRQICVRLDGIPLAIELAAARARMMAPTQIAERLGQRFRLLTGGGRTAVERHRTLQATVSWSYDLLDTVERTVFQRLSTFAGSFELDAAEAICIGDPVEGFEVLDAIGHLVDKSMVSTVPSPEGVRYRLLETLRQFAADRLAEQSDVTDVYDRHASYWRDRAVLLARTVGRSQQSALLDRVDVDIDNFRTAFAHMLSTGRVNDAARGILALEAYWLTRRTREGLRWYEQLLAHADLNTYRRIHALSQAAQAESYSGDLRVSARYATEAVELADAAGVDPPWGALQALLLEVSMRQDPVASRRLFEHARHVASRSNLRYVQLLVEAQAGMWLVDDDPAELIRHHERLQAEIQQLGDPLLFFLSTTTFSSILYETGEVDRARTMVHASIEPSRRAGPIAIMSSLANAAALESLDGDPDAARRLASEALRIARDEGFVPRAIDCVFVAALLAARRHDNEAVAVLLAGAAANDRPNQGYHILPRSCRDRAQAAIDAFPDDLHDARERGSRMTFDELIAFALDTLEP